MIAWNMDIGCLLKMAAMRRGVRLAVNGEEFTIESFTDVSFFVLASRREFRGTPACGGRSATTHHRTHKWSGTWRPEDEFVGGTEGQLLWLVRDDDRLTRGEWQ